MWEQTADNQLSFETTMAGFRTNQPVVGDEDTFTEVRSPIELLDGFSANVAGSLFSGSRSPRSVNTLQTTVSPVLMNGWFPEVFQSYILPGDADESLVRWAWKQVLLLDNSRRNERKRRWRQSKAHGAFPRGPAGRRRCDKSKRNKRPASFPLYRLSFLFL